MFGSMNTKFTQHPAWLLLGWVTISGWANRFSHPGQLSLVIPLRAGETSTGDSFSH